MGLKAISLILCLGIVPLACGNSSDEDLVAKVAGLQAKLQTMSEQMEKLSQPAVNQRRLSVTDDLAGAMDHMWLLICGALVMLMQAGFAMVEAGSCRIKNVQNIMMKNLVDVCLGTICWWAVGWMFAYGCYGDDDCKFAGSRQYFGHEFLEADDTGNQVALGPGGAGTAANPSFALEWFFQWAFCSAGATIVSGGVAERVKFPGYVIYTFAMTAFIYPVVVAWHWGRGGWMAPSDQSGHINGIGFNDFAGSGIVHMTGGVGALVGAIIVGPRKGRFDGNAEDFEPHSLPLIVLGTFILWFGWYGFNCGSTLGLSSLGAGQLAAIVAMNTTLSAAAGGLTAFVFKLALIKKYEVGTMCNGILAGLVSITAGCGNVESGSAFLIGIIGGIIVVAVSMLLKKLKIDDPVDAFAVHGAAGAWGVLAAALFDWGKGMDYYNGFGGGMGNAQNAVDGKAEGQWTAGFAAALVEIVVIVLWVGGLSTIIFLPLRILGMLRATDEDQEQGLDTKEHSPAKAYANPGDPLKVGEA